MGFVGIAAREQCNSIKGLDQKKKTRDVLHLVRHLTLHSSSLMQTSHTSQPDAPIQPTYPMATRSKNNITKRKTFTNVTIRYPIPHALLTDGLKC